MAGTIPSLWNLVKKQTSKLVGCPYANATKEFSKLLVCKVNINDLLVDLYFHFDWSSKRKNILEKNYFLLQSIFQDNEVSFSLVVWAFRVSYACTKAVSFSKHFYPLPRSRNKKHQCLNRIINFFSNPVFDVYCQILNSALESLINLNHFFKDMIW